MAAGYYAGCGVAAGYCAGGGVAGGYCAGAVAFAPPADA